MPRRADASRWASEWNGINLDAARFGELKEILRGHCADIGRDFYEITCSVTVRWDGSDYDALLASLAQWRDAGVDLAVIGLPTHAKPESLATIADVAGTLA